ncbi:MAG: TMEM165/GDT1 family protein [Fusicatenibacter saccharivorans]
MVLFLKVFLTEFIAEMGDKTQLMLIALTSKYKLKKTLSWEPQPRFWY